MHVLGIETSCDETSAAVVTNGKTIRSNIVVSSLSQHKKYGGVIPEIASRRQLQYINDVLHCALDEAKIPLSRINSIAVTSHPGLIGSLLVGLSFSKAIAAALNKPLIEVDHIKAHLYANFLRTKDENHKTPQLPAVGLVVSGGHTSLFHVKNVNTFKLIGQTRDDAVGEAYDKVGRILDLGYPGGPIIDKLAQQKRKSDISFTCAPLTDTLDFSFSGIKTAVLYYKNDHAPLSKDTKAKISFSFQKSVVSILVKKAIAACLKMKTQTLLVGGGVAANSDLRKQLNQAALKHDISVHFPPMSLCIDNAAMIAGLGFHAEQRRTRKNA